MAVVVGVAAAVGVLVAFGGESFFPGLVAGFLGSLFAFMLALAWERERELRLAGRQATELEERLSTEIQRRLKPVSVELEKYAMRVDDLRRELQITAEAQTFRVANPQLLDGAWTANAPRLSEVVADYELIGDLAIAYGRIENAIRSVALLSSGTERLATA